MKKEGDELLQTLEYACSRSSTHPAKSKGQGGVEIWQS